MADIVLDVLLVADDTGEPRGPADWPSRVVERPTGAPAPEAPWQRMTRAEYDTYRAARLAAWEAWHDHAQLPARKQEARAAVEARRVERLAAGKTIQGITVALDNGHQRYVDSLALAAKLRLDTGSSQALHFHDINDDRRELSPVEMIAFAVEAMAFVQSVNDRAIELRKAIDGAATCEALAAIDLAAGWPA